jgi:sterol desaturase/sphingolipid hydroxylase (fatty acid hydroxylase superfamily)
MVISLSHETTIRLLSFVSVLLCIALWEWYTPRRNLNLPRSQRWPANLGMVVVDSLAVRLLIPVLAVGAAVKAVEQGWGLFNLLATPFWLAFVISLLLLDIAIYAQHVIFHKVPLLWRLHRMHHSDIELDVSTALRFHPLEIILSMLFKVMLVVLLGIPAEAVLFFEILLNATAMFNHGNVRIPAQLDRVLRWFLVTPDMHRVHHSLYREETDSNFGFNLPWWDYLFGTYRPQPRHGHRGMMIGLRSFRDRRSQRLFWLLLQPFLPTPAPPRSQNSDL